MFTTEGSSQSWAGQRTRARGVTVTTCPPSLARTPCPRQPNSSHCLCNNTPNQLLLKTPLPAEFCPKWHGRVLWLWLAATSFTSPLSLGVSCKQRRRFAFSFFLYMPFNKRLPCFLLKWWWEQRPVKTVFRKIIIRNCFISAKASKSQKVSSLLGVFLFFIKTRKWDILICKFVQELKNIHSSFLRFLPSICVVVNGVFSLSFWLKKKYFYCKSSVPSLVSPWKVKGIAGL